MKKEDIEVPFNELVKDPNFILIVFGAVIWFAAAYIPLIAPVFSTAGFVLTCMATAASALKRPASITWPGLVIGAILYLVGQYLLFIPVLGNALTVIGAVFILFSVVPLALQYGNAPLMGSFSDILKRKGTEKSEEVKASAEPSEDIPKEVEHSDDQV